jgi:ribosomal protein S12 methylthiotransferase accessory factor
MDLPVPSFFGILRNLRHDPPRILVGGACDPDPNKAVLKTLLELAQSIQWTNHLGDQPFVAEEDFANVRTFEDRMRLYSYGNQPEAFQFLFDHPKVIELSSIPSVDLGDDSANVRQCCEELAKRNIELFAIDATSVDAAEAGLSVIKVLSPECQPMEADHRVPFLGGNRWRDVPVQLGLRSAPASINTMNPYPHPYP